MPRSGFSRLSVAAIGIVFIALNGCTPVAQSQRDAAFGPVKLRIHPTFTQIKDWTGDNQPDGIEAVVEFLDEVDEPVRASGSLMFELYACRSNLPSLPGDRILTPWICSLKTLADQAGHWSPALRAYTVQLAFPNIDPSIRYVLKATWSPPSGGRLFDQIIVKPVHPDTGTKRRVPAATGGHVGQGR